MQAHPFCPEHSISSQQQSEPARVPGKAHEHGEELPLIMLKSVQLSLQKSLSPQLGKRWAGCTLAACTGGLSYTCLSRNFADRK